MTLKSKTLAALTAFAVSGIALSSTASAAPLTPIQKIQAQLQAVAGPNVVLSNPSAGQTFATDDQFAAAVVAAINTAKISQKLSPKAAVFAAFNLANGNNANYQYASGTILQAVTAALAKNTTKLTQALAGAFTGFDYTLTTSGNSASAALIDTALLGIKSSTGLSVAKVNAAYIAAVKAGVKNAAVYSVGTSVGASAQFVSSTPGVPLATVIKTAVSKSYNDYGQIAQGIATAVKAILGDAYTDANSQAISDAVLQGYKAGFAASHGGVVPSKNKQNEVANTISGFVSAGVSAQTGLGATGLNNYAFVNLGSGPVTDIYGL